METNTLFRGMAVEWGSDEEVGEVRLNPMPESRAVRDEIPPNGAAYHTCVPFTSR
jgi:hypothetical protein